MVQHNNAIQVTLLESLAQAETGAFTHVREIIRLTENFAKWVGLNESMKAKVQNNITEQEHQEYKIHMGAMMVAMRDSEGSRKEDELNSAAGIERLKALNVLTGATMRAFRPEYLAAFTPPELEEPEYLTEIKNLGLKNMVKLAEYKL